MKIKWHYTIILIFIGLGKLQAATAMDASGALQEKLLLPIAELRTSQNFKTANWGAAIFTPKKWKNFPWQFKAGNLTAGGGISKLNNPLLSSTITPFSTAKTDVSIITAGLPGISTFNKPVSYFAELGFVNRKNLFSHSKINCFFNPIDEFPVFSVMQSVTLGKIIQITAAGTAGYFNYEENSFNSWFTTKDFYYQEGKHLCLMPQISFSAPHFQTLFSAISYETPFGKLLTVFKTENKITVNRYTFNISVFYNENEGIITADESKLIPLLQTKIGIQAKYAVGKKRPVFLKTGFTSYTAVNLKDADKEHKLKTAAGIKLQSPLYSFTLTGLANFSVNTAERHPKTDFDSASFQFSNSWHFKKIIPALTAALTLTPGKYYETLTSTEKLELSAAFFKNPKITAATAFSFTQKDGASTKQSNTTSLTAAWRVKCFSFMGKISLKFEE